MDPKEESGSNWPKLSPQSKLETLRRYRDVCLKKDDRFLSARDFFVESVIEEGLTQEYLDDIAYNNRT